MKWLSVWLLLIVLTSCEKKESSPQDEVKKNVDVFAEDYNQQDPAKLAALWSPDGVYISNNKTIAGRDQIEAYFKNLFKTLGKAKMDTKIDNIDLSDAQKASVVAKGLVTKANGEIGKSLIEADYVHTNGSWLIQSLEETAIQAAPSHYEHLKDLSWLIGDWEDDDANVKARSSYQWDYNKNFIIENFTYSTPDQEDLKVLQIIGWDPSEKRIRSWIFDSDGGFGKAFWVKDGKTWSASASHVLPDGRKSSSIHVYTLLDANSYSYAAESREVDGVFLPNNGPFKVVRKK